LLALDWGTTSMRAYLLAGPTQVLANRAAHMGIMHLPDGGFSAALVSLCGDWLQRYPSLPILAAGMVGSAQGWREAPYAKTPAGAADIASRLSSVEGPMGRAVHIVPGVISTGIVPNVMRGEETQIFGACALHHGLAAEVRRLIVLPGTHSKWVAMRTGRIDNFITFMTGELFATLRQHSILGRLMPTAEHGDHADSHGFDLGLATAREHRQPGLLSALFSVRTFGLTGHLRVEQLASYLSGLLIGYELLEAKSTFLNGSAPLPTPVLLVGAGTLCELYRRALPQFGFLPHQDNLSNAAGTGLWMIAKAAGLISTNHESVHA
jgi:2-dehydro-3-deoxygalactonokinase